MESHTTAQTKPSSLRQAVLIWRGDLHKPPEVFVLADTDEEAREVEKLVAEKLGQQVNVD